MEIRDQRVEPAELITRIDENIGPAVVLSDLPALCGDRLDRAAARRADRYHLAAAPFGGVDRIGRLLRHPVVLRMHLVLLNFLHADWPESTEADVQRDERDLHALCADLLEQRRREMQAGRRRGGGALLFRVHRLVALLVRELFLDIGRQRHLPDLIELCEKIAGTVKAEHPVAVRLDLHDLAGHRAARKGENSAGLCALAGACERFPHIVPAVFKQQELHVRARILLDAVNARRQHAGIVEHETVAGVQVIDNIAKMPVLQSTGLFVEHHQARGVPRLDRRLGDQLLRQVKVKIFRL